GDIGPGDRDGAVLVQAHRVFLREPAESRAVLEVDGAFDREPGHGPIHGARVQIPEPQLLGAPARDGALSGSGGPVDRHDHRWVTDSSRSKNSGKLIVTLSASSIVTPSRETSAPTAPSIAIRSSPRSEPTPPPFGQ